MNNKLFKISIITPSFNSGKFIERAIKSVLDQKYENFEHVVIDGGSTDETLKILGEYNHLTWISEPDKGQADAMNKGFNISDGEIIVYLNADDYFFPGAFNAVIEEFSKGAKFVVGNILVKSSRLSTEFLNTPRITLVGMLRHWEPNAFCHNPVGYFYLKEVQNTCPFNINNYATMDLEFLLDAASKYDFIKVEKTLGCFEDGEETKTAQTQARLDYWQKENFPYIDKHLSIFDEHERAIYYDDRRFGYAQMQHEANKKILNKRSIYNAEEQPLVSVIIPTYNCDRYLKRSINSVIKQGLSKIEIIVINDASTDRTVEVLEAYMDNGFIKVINNPNNIKIGASRNRGLDIAKGKYIFFLDGDDWLEKGVLKQLVDISEKYGTEITACGISKVDASGIKTYYNAYDLASSGGLEALEYFAENYIGSVVWNKLYLKDFLDKNNIKFITPFYHEDVIFTMECLFRTKKYISISEPGYNYFQRSGSIISSPQSVLHLRSYINLFAGIGNFVKENVGYDNIETVLLSQKLLQTHCSGLVMPLLIKYSHTLSTADWESEVFSKSYELIGLEGLTIADWVISSIREINKQMLELQPMAAEIERLSTINVLLEDGNKHLLEELEAIYTSRTWKIRGQVRKLLPRILPGFNLGKRFAVKFRKIIRKTLIVFLSFEIIFRHRKKKKILTNETSKKLVFVDHSYHRKTRSTDFLIDFLKKHFDLTVIDDESWKGVAYPDLSFVDDSYLGVVFFQTLPPFGEINKIRNNNTIFFPMYDSHIYFDYLDWRRYGNLKMINFSKTLDNQQKKWGFNSLYVQYFPKTKKFTPGNKGEIFFWQRIAKININTIIKLLGGQKAKIHMHTAVDPGHTFVKPLKEYEKKYKISYSGWFKTIEEMENNLGSLIRQKSIYIAPREYEGIGMSFLEAMAMGKAVIAVNNPTMNEYIVDGETGYLFDLASPKPIDLKDLENVQKKTYKYMCDGYDQWEADKHKIIDFIERP